MCLVNEVAGLFTKLPSKYPTERQNKKDNRNNNHRTSEICHKAVAMPLQKVGNSHHCDYTNIAASKPAQARSYWASLSMVHPNTFGHATACRSAALTFSATSQFTLKISTPCFSILSSDYPLVILGSEFWRSSKRHPVHSFPYYLAETGQPP